MAPKAAKGKGPVSTIPQFAFTAATGTPDAIPLAPYKSGGKNYVAFLRASKAKSYIGLTFNPLAATFSADLYVYDADTKVNIPNPLPPITAVDTVGRSIPLGEASIRWIRSNGRAFALVGTANHGIMAIGSLDAPYVDVNQPLEARPLQDFIMELATAGQQVAEYPTEASFIDGAVGEEHAVFVAVDPTSGETSVYGVGWSGNGAVGSISIFGGARPGVQSRRAPLQKINALGSEGITKVWAARHVTVAAGRRGTMMLGKVSEAYLCTEPRLIVPVEEGEVTGVGIANEGLWLTTSTGTIFMVDNHGEISNATASVLPQALIGTVQFSDLSCAASHCVARCEATGTLYGWGSNSFKQLGQGYQLAVEKATALNYPVKAIETQKVVAVPTPAKSEAESPALGGTPQNSGAASPGGDATPAASEADQSSGIITVSTSVEGKNISAVSCIGFRTVLYLPDPQRVVLLGE